MTTDWQDLTFHPIAGLFRMQDEEEFAVLFQSIEREGFDPLYPIIVHEGQILDGRNRWRACVQLDEQGKLKRSPVIQPWQANGTHPVDWVVRRNLGRRDLNSGERACLAVAAEEMKAELVAARQRQIEAAAATNAKRWGNGGDEQQSASLEELIPQAMPAAEPPARAPQTRDTLAKAYGTNPRYVQDMAKLKKAAPDLFEAVREKRLSLPDATRQLKQRERAAKREETRAAREAEQAARPPASLPRELGHTRRCGCPPNHLNCLDEKEWTKAQVGVWRFAYDGRDVRDKEVHPAVYPVSLAERCIELFTHRGELVLDPFVGSGSTLIAAHARGRNAVGFDLNADYVRLAQLRLPVQAGSGSEAGSEQLAIVGDAAAIPEHLAEGTVALILTSPPYADLLNRPRANKSMRGQERDNEQLGRVEQYSQDPRDLGTLAPDAFQMALARIFSGLLPLLRPGGHCVVNVADFWQDGRRHLIHIAVIQALTAVGFEFRNLIIWDRNNLVNNIGIIGWPSNFITLGTTFEFLLDFWRPDAP